MSANGDHGLAAASAEYERRALLRAAGEIKDPHIKKVLEQYAQGRISVREAGKILDEAPGAMSAVTEFTSSYDAMSEQERAELVKRAQSDIQQVAAELDRAADVDKRPTPTRPRSGTEDLEEDFDQVDWTDDEER